MQNGNPSVLGQIIGGRLNKDPFSQQETFNGPRRIQPGNKIFLGQGNGVQANNDAFFNQVT